MLFHQTSALTGALQTPTAKLIQTALLLTCPSLHATPAHNP